MKKALFCFILSIAASSTQAQKLAVKDVPFVVLNAFKDSFPAVKKAYWGKDSIHYHAGFFHLKAPGSVTYDSTGKRIITEIQVPVEDLPKLISDYIQKKYPAEMIKEAAKITDGMGVITYEVEIGGFDLIFDAKGNFLQSLKCYE